MSFAIGLVCVVLASVLFVKYRAVRTAFRVAGGFVLLLFGFVGLLLKEHGADAECPCGKSWPHTHY